MENIGKGSHLSSLTSKRHSLETPDLSSLRRSPLFLLNCEEEFTAFKMWNVGKKKKKRQTEKRQAFTYIWSKPPSPSPKKTLRGLDLWSWVQVHLCSCAPCLLPSLFFIYFILNKNKTEGCVSIIYHSRYFHCDGTKGLNKKEITVSNRHLPSQTIYTAHKQTAPPVFIFCSLSFLSTFATLWFKFQNNPLGSRTMLLIFQPSAMHSFCL